MKKKVLTVTLAIVMAFAMAACGSKSSSKDKGSADSATVNSGASASSSSTAGSSDNAGASKDAASGAANTPASDDASSKKDSPYATLKDLMESDEMAAETASVNEQLASSGLRAVLTAEGDVFVCQYYFADEYSQLNDLSEEQIAALTDSLDATIEPMEESMKEVVVGIEEEYGIHASSVRVELYSPNGTKLYESEFANGQ